MPLKTTQRFRRPRWSISLLIFGAIILLLATSIRPVVAATDIFTEDFTTTTYRDGAHSNVTGWGTGSVRFRREQPMQVGSLWSPSGFVGVCVDGDIAYLAAYESGLHVVNISNPIHPLKIGDYDTAGYAYEVFVAGDIAYVADGTSGLQLLNVSDPANPWRISTCSTPYFVRDVHVDGDYAYIADGARLRVIDVSNPAIPFIAGVSDVRGSNTVFVAGDYCFGGSPSGLVVYNIKNPTNPTYVTHRGVSSSAMDVHVSGNYAYVANAWDGLVVFNITDPTLPVIVGSVDTRNAHGVFVEGDFAYIADQDYGLQVIDISEPTNPVLVGRCDTNAYSRDVWVAGKHAYVADEGGGLKVIRIGEMKIPTIAGTYDALDSAQGLCIDGNHAFVMDGAGGSVILNIADPNNPTLSASYATSGDSLMVAVAGDYAYIADDFQGLYVINITNPAQPVFAGACATPAQATSIFVEGNYAYVAAQSSGLQIINITDPTSPSIVAACDTPELALDVWVAGDHAYVADWDGGVHVIDIADPTDPYIIGGYNPGNYVRQIMVEGNYAYVANGEFGLLIINVTDPTNPTFAASYNTPSFARCVDVKGNFAYVADDFAGLVILNVTDPRNPTLFGTIDTPLRAWWVEVEGDYAYICDLDQLVVVEIMQNVVRRHLHPARVQSLPVFESSSENVMNATLTSTHSEPTNTSITYWMSADNGANWEQVIPGVKKTFSYPGKQLVWKAILTTNDSLVTPTIFSLSITYDTLLDAPTLLSLGDGAMTNDDKPTFEWEMVPGAASYIFQIDSVVTFDSPGLIEVTVGGLSYTPASSLSDGTWYWRVSTMDTEGDRGPFSPNRTLSIHTVAPIWDQSPTNQVVELGSGFRYDLNASDPMGISHWWVNDTTHFNIDSQGVVTNVTPLAVATHGLHISVNDTYNNIQTVEILITIQDTIAPTWDQIPTAQLVEFADDFRYDLNATDLSGLGTWWINDTVHFAVSNEGVITSIATLACGEYGIEVRVSDAYDNPCIAYFMVTVEDTMPPSWTAAPANQVLEFGEALDYQLQATDLSGIARYEINETTHFSIDSTGRITNTTPLATGTYAISVIVYDTYNNYVSGVFSIIVQESTTTTDTSTSTTTTTTSTLPPGGDPMILIVIVGGVGIAVAVIVILIVVRRKQIKS